MSLQFGWVSVGMAPLHSTGCQLGGSLGPGDPFSDGSLMQLAGWCWLLDCSLIRNVSRDLNSYDTGLSLDFLGLHTEWWWAPKEVSQENKVEVRGILMR